MAMFKSFLPNQFYQDVYLLTPEYLKEHGIKGIITDLDNTLTSWDSPDATPELHAWFKQFQDAGIKVIICSNNKEIRVKKFADQVNMPFVFGARKPLTKGFMRAAKMMELNPNEIVVVGDQMMTDIFGGNRGGFHTVLVKPLVTTDEWKTYLNRRMERVIMSHFKKHNLLNWQEHDKK